MQTQTNRDPTDVASNVYNFVMENDRVRVLQATFEPGDKAVMHHHPDHVVYVLKGGKLRLTSEGKTNDMDLEPSKALFLNEQTHEAENIGDKTVDLLVVELKK